MKRGKKLNIKHDIHTHTMVSSCCHDQKATAENYILKAAELGHQTLGISNHLWDETVPGANSWYRDQPLAHVLMEKPLIRSLDPHGLKILFGAEVEYCGMSNTLAFTSAIPRHFDYVLIPHTHTHMQGFVVAEIPEVVAFRKAFLNSLEKNYPWMNEQTRTRMANGLKMNDMLGKLEYSREQYEQMLAEYMISSYEQLLVHPEFEKITKALPTIIAHPFSPTESGESFVRIYEMLDKNRLRQCFLTTAKMGVAFDVNICTYRLINDLDHDPMVKIMRIAKECGIKFSFGTDAHSVETLSTIRRGDDIADAIGITKNDLCNIV